jgi:small subunit ribosomal protein S1
MILDHDRVNSRVALSTKTMEVNHGDILRDMATVFENAEEVNR